MLTKSEKLVWAAAFALACEHFSCFRTATLAARNVVKKFREEDFTPVSQAEREACAMLDSMREMKL